MRNFTKCANLPLRKMPNICTMRHYIMLAGAALAFQLEASGQVYFRNPSFEGKPQDATVPVGWLACEPGSTPDILPGVWGVYQEAAHGATCVGLITREDGTWESIGQRLEAPLEKGQCYRFYLSLSTAKTYAGYGQPIKLRIWGGAEKCVKQQLLWESPLISHQHWVRYSVEFTTLLTVHYIILEAFHKEGIFSHKGNVLIDHLSVIMKCVRA